MKIRLPEYRNAHVLVVGDVILDRYWYGSSHRISPEAPVPIVNVEQKEARPGGAANVATNMASLGANVHLIGLTGVDKAADTLREQLRAAGVKSDLIAIPTHSTLTKLRVISRNQQLIRLDFEACFQNVEPAALLALIQCQLLTSPSALVLSDYNKGTLSSIQPIIQLSRAVGVPVLVDPKGNDFERYRGATVLTPNLAEFEAVVGRCASEQELVNKGLQLMADYDFQALLITRSEQGMTLFKSQQAPLHIPAQAQAVCDVTGAGDTVIAVLAASLAAGTPLDIACQFANTAAGLVVSKLGAASVSLIELENNISGRFDQGFGILSETELQQALVQARSRGERIVMTNGCFDILHAGHVAYLAQARQLGDRLIVAVNSDASVQRLKGEQRPINPLQCRMQVLAALSAVDWVVPFSEQTPHRLISEILPDILVKGGDYQPETIVGAETVLAAGGSVQVLHFEENCSTSAIIQTIRQSL